MEAETVIDGIESEAKGIQAAIALCQTWPDGGYVMMHNYAYEGEHSSGEAECPCGITMTYIAPKNVSVN